MEEQLGYDKEVKAENNKEVSIIKRHRMEKIGTNDTSLESDETFKDSTLQLSIKATKRLKLLVPKIRKDELAINDLILELQHIYNILKCLYKEQKREYSDSENLLNGMFSSFEESGETAAPLNDIIRSWLESTFTKNPTWKQTNRLSFKEAAIKIKARIRLHRLFSVTGVNQSVQPSSAADLFFESSGDKWNFEVFEMNRITKNHALLYVGFQIFGRQELVRHYQIPLGALQGFLMQLESGYSKYQNPYHNLVHAADVVQSCHSIITNSGLRDLLSHNERFALVFSALIHDYEHTGTTNGFQVNLSTNLALFYNDRSVQENHHVSAAFRAAQLPGLNIFVNLSKKDYQEIRQLSIEMVLNTDVSFHFCQIKTIGQLVKFEKPIEKPRALSFLLHCADISHPAKEWDLHRVWTEMLFEEFFSQGDHEKKLGLPCSPLCDRQTTPIAQSQLGFINFIVAPSFELLKELIQRIMDDEMQIQTSEDTAFAPMPNKLSDEFQWTHYLMNNKMIWQSKTEDQTVKPTKPS